MQLVKVTAEELDDFFVGRDPVAKSIQDYRRASVRDGNCGRREVFGRMARTG
jgi:hypothetical protein